MSRVGFRTHPVQFVRRLVGADAGVWVWLVDPSNRARRNDRDHDRYEVDIALVSYDVEVAAGIHESRSGRDHVGRARGVVAKIERRGTGLDDHQAGPGLAVPAEGPARHDRVL